MTLRDVITRLENGSAGNLRLPFKCFYCDEKPTQLTHNPEHVWIWNCSEHYGDLTCYGIDLSKLKDHSQAFGWTLHLMGKVWFPETNSSWKMRMTDLFGIWY